jgi:type I restriction enzyme S subunit
MKPYSAYKASSLSWLGQIPDHWTEKRAKWLFREVNERSESGNEELLSVSHISGVTPRKEKDVNMFLAESYEGYKLCSRDDLVINTMWAWMGAMGVSQHRGIVSSAYGIYRQKGRFFTPEFLDFLCRLPGFIFEYGRRSKGVTPSRARMYPADFFDIPLLCPPHVEQQAIVTFLEAKRREMETFISNKRRMIELLNEQKASLINRAVTRGLRLGVPLKPSGVVWLGEVPEHWELSKLRFLCSIQTGDKDTIHAVAGGLYPFFVRSQTVERINSFSYDCEAVLTAGDGAGVGKVFHHVSGRFDFHQRVYMLNNFRRVGGRYLFHFLKENFYKVALDGGAKSTVDSLRRSVFLDFPVLVPPIAEQTEIIAHVEEVSERITASIITAEQEIELMREYQTALITAAITGKIDVRQASVEADSQPRPPNRHFARALLSAEIVHQLHPEPTFGRIKHQKILHLSEYIGGIEEIQGEYHREAAGPLDNKLIYSVEAELKKQKWFAEYAREKFGHGYRPLEKAGGHRAYVEQYWKDKLPVIQRLIDLMRSWDTERCEIFSTTYAAWNDLLIWRKPVTDDAIVHEILHRWHDRKKQVPESRWRKALEWMRKEGFVPTGFGKPTAKCATEAGQTP